MFKGISLKSISNHIEVLFNDVFINMPEKYRTQLMQEVPNCEMYQTPLFHQVNLRINGEQIVEHPTTLA